MALAAPDSYSCASGGVIAGGRFRLPAWVPAHNTVATLTESNSFASIDPGVSPANGWSYNSAGSIIAMNIFAGTIDAYSGGVYNPYYGAKGCMVFNGGGHSISNWGGIAIFDLATLTYSVLLGGSTNCYPIDYSNAEYADGSAVSVHTYDTLAIVGPEAGYPLGALVLPLITGGTPEANATTRAAHLFDFAHPENGWVRFTENAAWISIISGPCSAYDPDLNRVWWKCKGTNYGFQPYIDMATGVTTAVAITNRIPDAAPDSLSMRYDSDRKLLIHMDTPTDQSVRRVYYLDTTNAAYGWIQATLSTPFPGPSSSPNLGFSFDKVPDGTYLCNTQGRIFRLTIPVVLTDPWPVEEITYLGAALNQAYVHGKRWSYIPALESFVFKASAASAHQIYRV